MSSAVAHGPAPTPILQRLKDPGISVPMAILAAAFVLLFHNWFLTQHRHSWGSADWNHAYFVPLISLVLLWQVRASLARVRFSIFWPGLVPMVAGISSYIFFIVGIPNHFGQGLAMILTLFGLVLLMLGPGAMLYCFFPIAYLVCAITIPEKLMNYVTWPLQQFAAQASFITLNAIGIRADLAGNVITVYDSSLNAFPLNVAEQCSGMRMVIAFIALGLAVAILGTSQWWKRVVLLALAVPIALLLNVVRVVVLGVAVLYDPRLASGEAHMFIGTLLLVPGFFLYMFVLWSMHKALPDPKPADAAALASHAPSSSAAAVVPRVTA